MLISLSLTTSYLKAALATKTLTTAQAIDIDPCLLSCLKQGNACLYFGLVLVW